MEILLIIAKVLGVLVGIGATIIVGLVVAFFIHEWRVDKTVKRNQNKYRCPECLEYLDPDPLYDPYHYTHKTFNEPVLISLYPKYDRCPAEARIMSLRMYADIEGFLFPIVRKGPNALP